MRTSALTAQPPGTYVVLGGTVSLCLWGKGSMGFPGRKESVNKTGAEEKLRNLGISTSGFLPFQLL